MKYTVLLVDDIFINRILLSEILKEVGVIVIEAKNGKEAIEILDNNSQIDIILMDIEMPVMNGFETTKYIRERFAFPKNEIPIIAVTAHDPSAFFDEYGTIGFSDLITKPYSVDKIENIFNKILNQKSSVCQ